MPEVVFQCQDKTKHVEKRFLSCLNKYLDEYTTKDRIVLSVSCDFYINHHCDSLCQLLNDDSSERVLSLLIQNQDHNIEISKYERSIQD